MVKEAVGVLEQDLIDAAIIPPKNETAGKDTYIPIKSFRELYKFIHFSNSNKRSRVRGGSEYDVEKDESFQQLIMYGVVVRDGKVLAYQRGDVGKYDEARLAGKFSLGIGGHFEPSDTSLPQSFYREFAEEVNIMRNGEIVTLPLDENGKILPGKAKELFSIAPVGIIKDERDAVGRVHLGIVCLIHPRNESITIQVKADGENVSTQYVSPHKLSEFAASGDVSLEGWSDIVLRNELLPRFNDTKN